MILFMSKKRFREIVHEECLAACAEATRLSFQWMRDRQIKQEKILSQLTDKIAEVKAAILAALAAEAQQIKDLFNAGNTDEAMAALDALGTESVAAIDSLSTEVSQP